MAKPNKSKVFCPGCGRTKICFDTEKAAELFIKYNGDEIFEKIGKRLVRAYYCDMCLAWHVTSMEKFNTKSTSQLLEKKYHINIDGDIETLKKNVSCIQTFFKNKQYIEAINLSLDIINSQNKRLYISQQVISVIEPCYNILQDSLSILLKLYQERHESGESKELLIQEVKRTKELVVKLNCPNKVRIYNLFKQYNDQFKQLIWMLQ